jgi:superfamily II DNA or RNA helicase
LGPVLFHATEKRLSPKVRRVWSNFTVASTPNFNPSLAPKALLTRFLCANKARNAQITEQLIQALQAGRKVIVLSERLKHLELLDKLLYQAWKPEYGKYPTTGKYVGGMTEEARKVSEGKNVIFATGSFAAEGLDIPALDTIFLTTPMSDIEQAVGRICRPSEGKKDPVVVDFRDDRVPMFASMGKKRDAFYKAQGI